MAFPIPQHLPRKGRPQDVSSHILTKIGEASNKSLNAELARTWIEELEGNIQQTKDRIYDSIHARLPEFEQQLETSKSVQARLQNLSRNVDVVSNAFSHPETGLLPTLVKCLTEHSALAQRTSDAAVLEVALAHLSRCRAEFRNESEYIKEGKLPHAVKSSQVLQKLLNEAPEAAGKAEVTKDLKRKLRIAADTIEEQLSEAYSRSVKISSTELSISSSVQVRQSNTIISLSDLLASLSPNSLSSHLAVLRRDVIAYFIELPTQQAVSFTVTNEKDTHGAPLRKFSIFPTPAHKSASSSTILYLQSLFDFLSTDLFSHLPNSSHDSFAQSLCKPTTDALLHSLLIPSLPSSLHDLPPFIVFASETATFERVLVSTLFGADAKNELDVSGWVNNIGAHYARKRRVDILRDARNLILAKEHAQERIFRAEVAQEPEQTTIGGHLEHEGTTVESGGNVEGWDFDDSPDAPSLPTISSRPAKSPLNGTHQQSAGDESGWDFEDDTARAKGRPSTLPLNGNPVTTEVADTPKDEDVDTEDAWGWGDDDSAQDADDEITLASDKTDENKGELKKGADTVEDDSSVWDNAWGASEAEPATDIPAPAPTAQPKAAKRLEKFSAKAKGGHESTPSWSSTSPPAPSSSTNGRTRNTSTNPPFSSHSQSNSMQASKPPARISPSLTSPPQKAKPKETYSVSGRAKDIVAQVVSVLAEGREVHQSDIFNDILASNLNSSASSSSSSSSPSAVITQTAPSVLDLYRALYPVAAAAELARYPDRAMRFANDCVYISEEVRKHANEVDIGGLDVSGGDMLRNSIDRTKGLGEWWYQEMVEKQCAAVRSTLERAEGFVDTGVQERFDECEVVMSDVLRNIRSVGSRWKLVLPRSKYFTTIGAVTESALGKILEDVLALGDIPEVDSRRLSELCRILNALEGLFIDDSDPDMPSMVVAHVPSWLKYSYLSELLEASIADISYLFDEGALIDFEVDELVGLVRALFADTPLRTNTIAKLLRGHPVLAT